MTQRRTDEPSPHYLGHRKRLKERFRGSGRKALADHELLELLLAYAIPRRDTKPLAKELLRKFGTFQAALDADPAGLEECPRHWQHASTLVALLRACMNRYLEQAVETARSSPRPEDVTRLLRAEMGGEATERFLLVCLNASSRVVHTRTHDRGDPWDAAHVIPPEVLKGGHRVRGERALLVHNHPIGTLIASEQDLRLTRTLTDLCAQVGISLHDHLIVTVSGAYSIASRPLPAP
jgi:DNA repair protein RadC